MKLHHVHIGVLNLPAAIEWMKKVWQVEPSFKNDRMVIFTFEILTLIFDKSIEEVPATIGFQSDDCDRDYKVVMKRGAISLEEPSDRWWGSRAAYVQGPGALKFEIEQEKPQKK